MPLPRRAARVAAGLVCLALVGGAGAKAVTVLTNLVIDATPSFSDEAAEPRYVVEVDSDASAPSIPVGGRTVTVAGMDGREYDCAVPPLGGAGGAGGSQLATADPPPPPASLLRSLEGGCVYRVEDWWTYEFCFEKHVRQFHREGDETAAEFLLGAFDPSAPAPNTVQTDVGAPAGQAAFVAQTYGGGEACDLTGAPRAADVRFVCADSGTDALLAVREPATCRYAVTVAVAALCGHPGFRPPEPPTLHIRCAPREGAGGGERAAGAAGAGMA